MCGQDFEEGGNLDICRHCVQVCGKMMRECIYPSLVVQNDIRYETFSPSFQMVDCRDQKPLS